MRLLYLFTCAFFAAYTVKAQLGTTTFNYTGTMQTYVVPPCVTQIQVLVRGAKGGGPNGGNGSSMTGTMNVSPGQVLEIRVGGQGALGTNSGGFNGGGTGHPGGPASGGGGGASDIRIAPYGLANRFAVAGGGGGRGGGAAIVGGGFAACPNGNAGTGSFGGPGQGGNQAAGGGGGAPWGGGTGGPVGTLGQGAQGAADPCFAMAPGGGGGGGRYGGGGGGSDCCCPGADGGGGGGAGSSLVPGGFTCTQNIGTGNGLITITPVGGMILAVSPTAPIICEGQSVDLTISGGSTYEWSPGQVLSANTGSTVTASPSETQTFEIIGTLGNCIDTAYVTVNVVAYPTLSIDPPNPSGCDGEPIVITAAGADSYTWSPATDLNGTVGSQVTATPTQTTNYTLTGSTQGCASEMQFTIAYQISVDLNEQICNGQTYALADGTVVGEGGVYETILTSVLGCDSVITVNLTQNATYELDNPIQICQGEMYTLPNGANVGISGTYPVLLATLEAGCDSTITTILEVNPLLSSIQSFALCNGETGFLPDGTPITETGVFNTILSSLATGCDSTVTTTLIFSPVYFDTFSASPCDDAPYTLPDGTAVSDSGTYTNDFITDAGCDSIVVVTVNFQPAYNLSFNPEMCQGESYMLPNGTSVSAGGTYTSQLVTTAGCDSTITVNLTVNPLPVLSLGLADSYCPYQIIVPIAPAPSGGQLSGSTVQGNQLVHTGVSPGNYSVGYAYTDSNGCSSTISAGYVLAPAVSPQYNYTLFCSEIRLFNLTDDPDGNLDFGWTLDGEEISTQSNPVYLYDQNGLFDLTLTVTDQYGCAYTNTQEVELTQTLDLTGFYIPNIITPNGDGINDTLAILPIVSECLDFYIKIFNRWGQEVFEMNGESGPFAGKSNNGAELPAGEYFYSFSGGRIECESTTEFKAFCNGTLTLKRED